MSMAMARAVGKSGKVFSVDLQEAMLKYTVARAAREGHSSVVVPVKSTTDDICVQRDSVNFGICPKLRTSF